MEGIFLVLDLQGSYPVVEGLFNVSYPSLLMFVLRFLSFIVQGNCPGESFGGIVPYQKGYQLSISPVLGKLSKSKTTPSRRESVREKESEAVKEEHQAGHALQRREEEAKDAEGERHEYKALKLHHAPAHRVHQI